MPLRSLLLLQLMFMLGFACVVPFIAAIGQHRYGLDAAAVGLVVGIRVISQQGLFVLGGALTDLFGPRSLLLSGCLLRALGLATIAWAPTTAAFIAGVVVVGAAGALFSPAVDALVARVDAGRRSAGTLGRGPAPFAALALVGEAGGAVAALAVSPMMPQATTAVSAAAAATFLLAAVFVHVLIPRGAGGSRRPESRMPATAVDAQAPAPSGRHDLPTRTRSGGLIRTHLATLRPVLPIIVVGSTFLALNANLFSLVPLVFEERQIPAGRMGLVAASLSVATLLLQWPLSRLAERTGRHIAIRLGLLSGACGALLAGAGLAWAPSGALTALFCLVAAFTACALMLGTPSAQSLIAAVPGTWTATRLALLPTAGGIVALALTWTTGALSEAAGTLTAWLVTAALASLMLAVAVIAHRVPARPSATPPPPLEWTPIDENHKVRRESDDHAQYHAQVRAAHRHHRSDSSPRPQRLLR